MKRSVALLLTGLALALPAAADDDVVRIGGHVDIAEAIDGSLHAAGGHITVRAPIGGEASLAAGRIEITGPVTRDLHAAAGYVRIDGPVGGDVAIAAGTLELGPEARISGNLTFLGGRLERDPAAVVYGALEQSTGRIRKHFPSGHGGASNSSGGWFWTTTLLILAALVAAALPGPTRRLGEELRERPWLTALVGFVALITIPIAAVLLMITIIGIPLGIIAIAGYAMLLLLGYVWLAVAVGGLLLERVKPETAARAAWRAGAAALAMLTLAFLARVPFLGGLVVFAALVVGVGMVVAVLVRRTPAAPAPMPAA